MRFRPSLGPAARRPFTARPGNTPPLLAVRFPPTADAGPADPLGRSPDLARLEAALFLADEPLTARKLAEAAGLANTAEATRLVGELRRLYDADGTAFQIEDIAGGFQLLTRPAFHPWLTRSGQTAADLKLSPAALETLAVIASKQPVTRADVEAVRGVGCNEMIRLLMERGLVRNAGRHPSLGRPQLYGTTKKFLRAFGLNTLADLPAELAGPGR